MELSLRTVRIINRLLRKPFGITSCRNVAGTAVKEEVNTELLNSFNQDIRNGGVVPVFRRALLFPTRVALQDEFGIYTYAGLYQAASVLSQEIAAQLVGESERTIAYMCSNDASHIIVQWAIWMTGNIVAVLKKRWKNLKDQYRKELKKLPTPRSGDPGDNIQSTWQFFQQMNFLRFEILPDNSDTNLTTVDSQLPNTSMSSPCIETNSSESVIRESDINLCSPTDSVNAQEQTSVGDDEVCTTNTSLSINTASSSSRSPKRKTANDIRMEMLELEKKRLLLLEKDLQQNSNANQSGESKSEDYYYLMSLLPQMESFTPLQKFNVRNRINQVMMEEIHNSMFGDPYRGNSSSSWSHGYRTQTPE